MIACCRAAACPRWSPCRCWPPCCSPSRACSTSRAAVCSCASATSSMPASAREPSMQSCARSKPGGDGQQPVRDLDTVRSFLSGPGPTALFDLPWIPLYLAICFAFHTLIGVTAVCGAVVLIGLTLATEFLSRDPVKAASTHAAARNRIAEASRRNAEVVTAMGMSERLLARWLEFGHDYLAQQKRANDVTAGLGSTGRVLRAALQSTVLAVGAYLVIQQEATAGIIIASSILTGRALAPIDVAIANWKGFVAARQGWQRLHGGPPRPARAPLPRTGAGRRDIKRHAPWRPEPGRARRRLQPQRRQCARGRGAERLWQVIAGARDRRGLAGGRRLRAARPGG